MLLAQRVDLTFSSFDTKSIALSHHIPDAPLSRWSSSRRSSSWETAPLAEVVRPTSPLIEFVKDKIGAESPSKSPCRYSNLEVHESREEFPTSYIPLLHSDLRQHCEGEEGDAEVYDYPKLDAECVISVVVQPPLPNQVVDSEYESIYDEWNEHDQDDIIPFLYSLKQNIFVESMNPKIAPHIVITLCEDTWDDQTVAWCNRVDIQSPSYLHIPPTDVSEFVLHPRHDYRVMTNSPTTPPLVFNYAKFHKLINRSSVERLIMFEVILVLRKQLCRIVAFEASKLALSLRQRYNSHTLLEELETSIRWTDPAESLLSCYRRYRGTTFLESPSPFRAPHIVISAPPPEDPWCKWLNQVNDPQDCGFGRYLVIPTRGVEIINELEDPFQDSMHYAKPEYGECAGTVSYRFFVADNSEEDDVSSSVPETPTDEHEAEDFKTSFERALEFKFGKNPATEPLEDHQKIRDPLDEDLSLAVCGTSVLMDEFGGRDVERLSRPSCRPHVLPLASENENGWLGFKDNDEEDDPDDDDLPPLDEWYQSVMRRTDTILQTVTMS